MGDLWHGRIGVLAPRGAYLSGETWGCWVSAIGASWLMNKQNISNSLKALSRTQVYSQTFRISTVQILQLVFSFSISTHLEFDVKGRVPRSPRALFVGVKKW